MPSKILFVGATGATGKHVVQMMLDRGDSVVAVVRSKESMLRHLKEANYDDSLKIHEAAIMDLSHEDLVSLTKDCDLVVSCLGHNVSFKGMFVKDRRLVTEAAKRLTKAMPSSCKFILMGSDGVAHTGDPKRGSAERFVLFLLRYLVPPHTDNEKAAAYLRTNTDFEWAVVRPTNLINEDEATGMYTITEQVETPLFGDQTVSRNNVAHFMVELMSNEKTYAQYKHKMPVLVGTGT
jgi:putative NADH-flavin reductase